MVLGNTLHHAPGCLEAIDNLARLTDQLRRAADSGDPGFADLAQSCAQAFQDLQQVFALKSIPTRDSNGEDRRALLDRLSALSARTTACARGLASALGETEQRLQVLRTQQRAARGYRNCPRRS